MMNVLLSSATIILSYDSRSKVISLFYKIKKYPLIRFRISLVGPTLPPRDFLLVWLDKSNTRTESNRINHNPILIFHTYHFQPEHKLYRTSLVILTWISFTRFSVLITWSFHTIAKPSSVRLLLSYYTLGFRWDIARLLAWGSSDSEIVNQDPKFLQTNSPPPLKNRHKTIHFSDQLNARYDTIIFKTSYATSNSRAAASRQDPKTRSRPNSCGQGWRSGYGRSRSGQDGSW